MHDGEAALGCRRHFLLNDFRYLLLTGIIYAIDSTPAGKLMALTSLELCAGAGGQAIGLEAAGYEHEGLVEIDRNCCNTLRLNRPDWNILEG